MSTWTTISERSSTRHSWRHTSRFFSKGVNTSFSSSSSLTAHRQAQYTACTVSVHSILHITTCSLRVLQREHQLPVHLQPVSTPAGSVHSMHVHVRKLVTAGHKVGIVRQTETAAIKASEDMGR